MSAAEWIALAVAATALIFTLAVLAGLRGLRRSVDSLHVSIEAMSNGAATIDDLKAAVRPLLTGEPEPMDEPEPVVSRVPPVLRTRSVVKAMAIGTGTAHAARRLRNGNGKGG
ncbi:MAG: hypothetical protein QOG87_1438 [Actinomycetota bacterium]